jgi:site-specific DNA-methyltransferase (adenine-specific)
VDQKESKKRHELLGMGAYTRANAEICLLGVTPGFKPMEQLKSHAVHQVIESPVEEHSKKPEETRRRIIELLGDVPRIELFARQRVPGWDAWGNEIEEKEENNDPHMDT